jgi:hypothetical protein
MTNIVINHPVETLYQGIDDLSNRYTDHGRPDVMLLIFMMLLISRRPDGSGRAARHAYLGRYSIKPLTILLRKQKYRLIGIRPFTCRAIVGAPARRP